MDNWSISALMSRNEHSYEIYKFYNFQNLQFTIFLRGAAVFTKFAKIADFANLTINYFSLPRSCNINIPRSLKEQMRNTSIYLVLYTIGQNKHATHEYTLLFNPSAKTNMQHININSEAIKIQRWVKSGPAFCSCYKNRLTLQTWKGHFSRVSPKLLFCTESVLCTTKNYTKPQINY